MRSLIRLAVLLAVLCALPARAQPVFTDATIGAPDSGKTGEFYRPSGPGPFPAVVVLHACNGVSQHERDWADRLRGWGFAALMIDSFASRGTDNVCGNGRMVDGDARAQDAFRAAAWLRRRTDIQRNHVAVIGFSHGGWAVIRAVQADAAAAAREPPFAAAVAYYPVCNPPTSPLATDTLIQIGADDDWTPAARCQDWIARVQRAGHVVDLRIYPGVVHGFDRDTAARVVAGHHIAGDPAASRAAAAVTRAFLRTRLGG